MTTAAWATSVNHTTDAEFRAWGSELSAKFAEVGLVQTADTGQINWTTATRPGTNSFAGDEFWAFNDSLQGSYPLYLRVRYGTGGVSNQARFSVALGTGTSGAGALTGLVAAPSGGAGSYIAATRNGTGGASALSFLCHAEGFLGIAWKKRSQEDGFFQVIRSTDTAGDPDGKWACLLFSQSPPISRTISFEENRVLSEASNTATSALILVPGNVTSSTFGGSFQAYVPFVATPKMSPLFGLCGIIENEIPLHNTFKVKLVGDTERTYLNWGFSNLFSDDVFINWQLGYLTAMLWE